MKAAWCSKTLHCRASQPQFCVRVFAGRPRSSQQPSQQPCASSHRHRHRSAVNLALPFPAPPSSRADSRRRRFDCSMPSPPASNSGRATIPSRTGSSIRSPSPSQFFASYRDPTLGIFALLLGFRIVNALTLRTFFQPDEFFQSLEPAWQLAFGQTSNAWITWVNFSFRFTFTLHPSIRLLQPSALSHDSCRSGEAN